MPKRIEDLKIVQNKQLTDDVFILELAGAGSLSDILPGQFAEIRVDGSPDTFLRRPFSIHDIDYESGHLRFMIQVAGKGTEALSKLDAGSLLNLIYPLGNSFTVPEPGSKVLLTGGGCGVAPLMFLGKYLKNKGFAPDFLLGFRSRNRILELNEYSRIGTTYLTTEDGSEGIKGFVTDHPVFKNEKYDMVYCCGPEPMMKAVGRLCLDSKTSCEVSLENLMGCGIGACLCCVVETTGGNLTTCIDGPVFDVNVLKW